MICVNELGAMKCHSREVLADLLVLLAPFAPHVSEELWHAIGNEGTICDAVWPEWISERIECELRCKFQREGPFQHKRACRHAFGRSGENSSCP